MPAPRTNLRERHRIELQELIYETSLERFRSLGFEQTKVAEITAAAGIAKGTFFNHFPSKDHVLQEWYRKITRTGLRETASREFPSGRDEILFLLATLVGSVSKDPLLWDAKAGATSNALLREEEHTLDIAIFSTCSQAIERDIASGLLSPNTNAALLTEMVLTVLTGTGHGWTISGHAWSLEEAIHARISFVLDAAKFRS